MSHKPTGQMKEHISTLHRCRDMALALLTERVTFTLNKVEPALMDFIDKADTNQGQFQFIDAISGVRKHREKVEQRFSEELARGFSEFARGKSISYPLPLLESHLEAGGDLTLMDDNELDQRLSLQKVIERTQADNFQQLYALQHRLSMLRGGDKLTEPDIPAGPVHITSSFQLAATEFGFKTNILLIIYTLFGKFVMGHLERLYDSYNQHLIDAGIFPNLKLEAPKNPYSPTIPATSKTDRQDGKAAAAVHGSMAATGRAARGGHAGGSAEESEISLGEEVFNSIRQLMAERRRHDPHFAQHPDFNPNAPARPMVDSDTLVDTISSIQNSESQQFMPELVSSGKHVSSLEIDSEILEEVRKRLIEEREKLFQGVDPNTIPSADLDTIELVGMLFEHVLNEGALPNVAKALISHLHTPYLKVAILDHHFLIDSRHIARRLLNLMVESGCDWIEEDNLRRGIYYPMQEGIDRILHEFSRDLDIFEQVYRKLKKQLEDLEQKAKVVESRAQEAAKGRERLENARIRARRIIRQQTQDRRFHPTIERFLNHIWLDKMILMLLRDPEVEKSAQWGEVISVIDDIIDLYEARGNPGRKEELRKHLPDLQQRIEEGLSSMGDFHRPDLRAMFTMLDNLVSAESDLEPVESISIEAPASAGFNQAPAASSLTPEKPTRKLTEEEKKVMEDLKQVQFGTWFELENDQQQPQRLKLSWYSPVTQKYMFVDKSGMQAKIIPVEELAKQIRLGKARILTTPSSPFVDRALRAVFNLLQNPFSRQETH